MINAISVKSLQQRFYPSLESRSPVPGFLHLLTQLAGGTAEVLDIGAGAGHINRYSLKGNVKKLIGIDVVPGVVDNPLLDVGISYDGKRFPLEDQSIDVAFSIYVQEHIQAPRLFAEEISRVLRRGGVYVALTPNMWHYVPLVAALTPHRFHEWVNRGRGRDSRDTFPTYYNLNTEKAIRREFGSVGLRVEKVDYIEVQPNYLLFSSVPFLFGIAYERMVNSFHFLRRLRVNMVSTVRKL